VKYPKEIVLKDGTEAIIRPFEKEDQAVLMQFYAGIPDQDRWYMKYDVMDHEVIHKWIDRIGTGTVFSTIALAEEKVIGHASLHMQDFGCTKHMGRLRVMVIPDFRHQRLGTWMLLNLIRLAMDRGLEELRADFVVGIEDSAIDAAYKLDFFKKAVLEDYIADPDGQRHDLMIMMKRLHKGWGDF
jgi:L-amino acid N-acyltransferase YncA